MIDLNDTELLEHLERHAYVEGNMELAGILGALLDGHESEQQAHDLEVEQLSSEIEKLTEELQGAECDLADAKDRITELEEELADIEARSYSVPGEEAT